MPSPYTFVALTLCLDDQRERLLMVQEARPDCRGSFYVPAGRTNPGEDPLVAGSRLTRTKTGLHVDILGVVGVEHNPPVGKFAGQLRVLLLARAVGGALKQLESTESMGARWVRHDEVRRLKLRSDDFLPWMDDVVMEISPILPTTSWRSLA